VTVEMLVRVIPGTIALLISLPAMAQTSPVAGRASVVDADTIEIHGERIGLHGIDAPESAQTCQRDGKEWHCGQAAALALSDWLGSATVSCVPVERDRYQRIVAKCGKAGQDVAVWLVSQGWALDWPLYSGGAYATAQGDASKARRGIWGSVFQSPWEWRATNRR
jgi:endonuclease YncB( thermonuclease family)